MQLILLQAAFVLLNPFHYHRMLVADLVRNQLRFSLMNIVSSKFSFRRAGRKLRENSLETTRNFMMINTEGLRQDISKRAFDWLRWKLIVKCPCDDLNFPKGFSPGA